MIINKENIVSVRYIADLTNLEAGAKKAEAIIKQRLAVDKVAAKEQDALQQKLFVSNQRRLVTDLQRYRSFIDQKSRLDEQYAAKAKSLIEQQNVALQRQVQQTQKNRAFTSGAGGQMLLGGAWSTLKGGAALVGGFGLAKLVLDVRKLEEQLTETMIQGRKTTEWMDSARTKILALSKATGVAKETLGAYISEAAKAGHLDYAVKNLPEAALIMKGARIDPKTLVGIIDQLEDIGIPLDQLKRTIELLKHQEASGGGTLADILSVLNIPIGTASSIGKQWTGLAGVGAVSGLTRIGTQAGAEPAQAAKWTQKLLDVLGTQEIEKKAALSKLLGEGFQSLAPGVLVERLAKISKDPRVMGSLEKLFGKEIAIVKRLAYLHKEGWMKEGGGGDLFDITKGRGILEEAAKKHDESAAGKWSNALSKIAADLHEKLLPAVVKLSEAMPTIATALSLILQYSKHIIALWLAIYTQKFVAGFAGMPIGGAPPGGGAPTGPKGTPLGSTIATGVLATAAKLLPYYMVYLAVEEAFTKYSKKPSTKEVIEGKEKEGEGGFFTPDLDAMFRNRMRAKKASTEFLKSIVDDFEEKTRAAQRNLLNPGGARESSSLIEADLKAFYRNYGPGALEDKGIIRRMNYGSAKTGPGESKFELNQEKLWQNYGGTYEGVVRARDYFETAKRDMETLLGGPEQALKNEQYKNTVSILKELNSLLIKQRDTDEKYKFPSVPLTLHIYTSSGNIVAERPSDQNNKSGPTKTITIPNLFGLDPISSFIQ